MADTRKRNWATIIYPESMPFADQLELVRALDDLQVPCFLSPLHSDDIKSIDDETGEIEYKKPHYHLLLCYEGKQSHDSVKELTEKLGGVGLEDVRSVRAYARYLCHLDVSEDLAAEKPKYNVHDVYAFGGLDYRIYIDQESARYDAVNEMIDYIEAFQVTSFRGFVKKIKRDKPEWLYYIQSGTTMFFIKSYISSLYKDVYENEKDR